MNFCENTGLKLKTKNLDDRNSKEIYRGTKK